MVSGTSSNALSLELLDELTVVPADGLGEVTNTGELAASLEADDGKSAGDNNALNLGVSGGDTLESLEAIKSLSTVSSLVGEHTTDSAPEDAGRSLVVERTTTRVSVHALAEEVAPEKLVALEGTRHVELLSADADDLLAVEKFLGNETSQATKEVTLAVNDDNLKSRRKETARDN